MLAMYPRLSLTDDQAYSALTAHDARFDGCFFVGVTSTGIYCRPVCRVRLPQRKNCRFFLHAAGAEHAGFRPCLRCRPELAPQAPQRTLNRSLAHAAAIAIEQDGSISVAALAEKIGLSERHLRRMFEAEFGVTPVTYAQTHRLLLAKRLLTDSTLPVIEVAHIAGFGSVRRLNTLFQTRYGLTPSALRSAQPSDATTVPSSAEPIILTIPVRLPYASDAMMQFLAPRAMRGVEAVEDGAYLRTVALRNGPAQITGWLRALPPRETDARPSVQLTLSPSLFPLVPRILARVAQIFDTACDPIAVAATLGPLGAACPGRRVPGTWDGFELAVRAILGQQVTVRAANVIAGRVAQRYGSAIITPWPALTHTFPDAHTLAKASVDDLGACGVIRSRGAAIIALAEHITRGSLTLDESADVEATCAALQSIKGIGPWTAQYIALRALHWPDAFPLGDVAIRKAMGETSDKTVATRAEAWRPWRAYAVAHLWASLNA
jgi:AraC family transcriptional regulator, regulatory protein of adaptative response / DNA-3-methyladenine glycosylase II